MSIERADSEFCDRSLGEVSRTFAVSIRRLPKELQCAVRTAYLICRIVDTVEDDRTLSPSVRVELFDAFDFALAGARDGDVRPALAFEKGAASARLGRGAERTLCERAHVVFEAFTALGDPQRSAIALRLFEMSNGMRSYAVRADARGGLRISDLPDLERYCHYVAGTVGEFLTDLFSLACPLDPTLRSELDARASRFGIGLQLVNILKDIAEDWERGDCYLPEKSAVEHGVDLNELFSPAQRVRALELCRSLSRKAREHLSAAEGYTLLWPQSGTGRDVREFCAGPLALALGTLRLVEMGTETLVAGKAPSVSRDFVASVFGELGRAVAEPKPSASDAALVALFDKARVGVAGRPSRPPAPVPMSQRQRRPEAQQVATRAMAPASAG